jgi:heavy metal sensor kinase
MTLRARLTILYAVILGVILALFGVTVFTLVTNILIGQVDITLESAAVDTIQIMSVTPDGRIAFNGLLAFDDNVVVQVWDLNGNPVGRTQAIEPARVDVTSLNPVGLKSNERAVTEVSYVDLHFRVLTIPLETELGRVGTLQTGVNLSELDQLRNNLLRTLLISGGVTMLVAALVGWYLTRRALAPLSTVTETALQITRADDLSRRIPEVSNRNDEVGTLIQTFNATLVRLEELFNSQRRFLADVSHELRTPLTVIKGNADLMRRMSQLDEEALDTIEGEVDRLSRMVGDLLLLAQADAGHATLDLRPVELDTILLEVFQQAHILASGNRHLEIEDIDQVIVCGDRDRLKQVFLNLVANAVKYTEKGGLVKISLGKQNSMAYLRVQDNGPGIADEDLPHIFDRFYRAEKSRSRDKHEHKGFGLGLSITNWIVENHGGAIKVVSVVGKGTTFTVWLPLSNGNCEPPVMREEHSNGFAPAKIKTPNLN